ncbi:MAG: hypothetical protein CMO34_03980 [Verrucomicrobia bacterium]|nr:hypothetical protein [Verrucomicrobiota bacterium]
MKKALYFLIFVVVVGGSCSQHKTYDEAPHIEKWSDRKAEISKQDSLIEGSTYLSVYSHIYSYSEHSTQHLTSTISLRNTSRTEKVFVNKAEYFNTHGELVKTYIDETIFIRPMETIEIMIFEKDDHGGTGGNFIFDWATRSKANKPYFEAAMISTNGQQGLSFTTRGVEINTL